MSVTRYSTGQLLFIVGTQILVHCCWR